MIVLGASGHAKVILDMLILNKMSVEAIYDTLRPVEQLFGVPVYKDEPHINLEPGTQAVIAIGGNDIRKNIAESRDLEYVCVFHPSGTISEFAEIGAGTVAMAQSVVNPGAAVGKHCIINTGAVVEHDCILGDYVHISPNASLAGSVTIGEGSHIGIGATVIQGVNIGRWVTVGAGAVIIRDIPDGATVVGNPGKIIKISSAK